MMKKHALTEDEVNQFMLVLGLTADVIVKASKGNAKALLQVREAYLNEHKDCFVVKRWR